MTSWLFVESCHRSRSMSSRIWKTLFTLVCSRFDGSYFQGCENGIPFTSSRALRRSSFEACLIPLPWISHDAEWCKVRLFHPKIDTQM
jgi:hypothetical protein